MTQTHLVQGLKGIVSIGVLAASLDAIYVTARDSSVSVGKWLLLVFAICIVWGTIQHLFNREIKEQQAIEREEAREKKKSKPHTLRCRRLA